MASNRRGPWVEEGISSNLCLLALGSKDRDSSNGLRRGLRRVPPGLYSATVAPFLRFEEPLPNQLYALGGRNQPDGVLDTVEMFDTWHGEWVPCPRMTARRAGCAAASLPDGSLLVVGGYDERGITDGLLSSCERFDPQSQRWSPSALLGRARFGHGCASMGGLIYAVGGCTLDPGAPREADHMATLRHCEAYDFAADGWAPVASLQVGRAGARVVAIGDSHLAAVGGCDDVFGRAETLPTVEIFDVLGSRTWSLLGTPLAMPRTTAAVASLGGRQLLVMGGAPSLASAEVYSVPDTTCELEGGNGGEPDESPAPDVPQVAGGGRMGCQAAALRLPPPGGAFPVCTRPCVVVVGGENGLDEPEESQEFGSVLVFDTELDAWRDEASFPPMPTARTAMALVVGPGLVTGHSR